MGVVLLFGYLTFLHRGLHFNMTKAYRLLVVSALLLQAACVSVSNQPREIYRPEQVPGDSTAARQPPSPPATLREVPAPLRARPPARSEPIASSPAVLALLSEAESNRKAGELDNAASALERGIRIQPRNPLLWHELAVIRLQQHQPGLAEDLAKKSNQLARGSQPLTQRNWAIIAQARRAKGDLAGAEQAERNAGN
jgi:predicted Zn-dependent protease